MMSQDYQDEYEVLLSRISRLCGVGPEVPADVCAHWPMHTQKYTGRLLVVGQALNGWMAWAAICGLADQTLRADLLARTRSTSESSNAWEWMRPQVFSRPFWRIAQLAMGSMNLELEQIAWSNLAKISPGRGNPTGALLSEQHVQGGQLLRMELSELDPSTVLILSGRGYLDPFLDGAGIRPGWAGRDGALHFDGQVEGRRWIVVSHPGTFVYRFKATAQAVSRALG
jgi:hypothetical protein